MTVTKEMIEAAKAAYWHEAHNGDGYSDKCYEAAISAALSRSAEAGKPVAHLVWLQGRRAADDVEDYYEVARPGDKCVDGSDPFPVYDAATLAAKDAEIATYRAGIKRLSDEEELCAETTGDDPFSMVYLAAKLAAAEAGKPVVNLLKEHPLPWSWSMDNKGKRPETLIDANGAYVLYPNEYAGASWLELGEGVADFILAAVNALSTPADIEPVGYVTASNMRALKSGLQGVMTASAVKNAHFSEPLYAAPVADGEGNLIADAVLSWMVANDYLDGGNEYRAEDVVQVLNDIVEPVSVPEGWQFVPKKPTQEMLDSVTAADQHEPFSDGAMRDIFVEMLAAAPQPNPSTDAEAVIERLTKALEPLSKAADRYANLVLGEDIDRWPCKAGDVTLGDLREARSALAKSPSSDRAASEADTSDFMHRLVENAFSWAMEDTNYLDPKATGRLIEATRRGMKPEEASEWRSDLPEILARKAALAAQGEKPLTET